MLSVLLKGRWGFVVIGLLVSYMLVALDKASRENSAFKNILNVLPAETRKAKTRTEQAFKQAEALMRTKKFRNRIKVMQESVRAVKYRHNKGDDFKVVEAKKLQQMDLGEILKKAYALRRQDQKAAPKLYVFVSYSMPESSIRNLYRDANQIGAPLLVRGLINNNFTDTARKMVQILGTKDRSRKKTSILINPILFKKFGIKRVPAFVFIKGEDFSLSCRTKKACEASAPEHDVVYGDITLKKAVETLSLVNESMVLAAYEAALAGRQ